MQKCARGFLKKDAGKNSWDNHEPGNIITGEKKKKHESRIQDGPTIGGEEGNQVGPGRGPQMDFLEAGRKVGSHRQKRDGRSHR